MVGISIAAGNSRVLAAIDSPNCTYQIAPGKFPFRGDPTTRTREPTDIGIVTQGFVGLEDASAVPGIDVSKWQDATDFVFLKACAKLATNANAPHDGRHPQPPFVYVRMTAGEDPDHELEYSTHWANARHENLFVGPYHYLDIIDAKSSASKLSADEFSKLLKANLDSADKQARVFIDRFSRLLTLDPAVDVASGDLGKPYLPIVLDLSDRPQAKYSDDDTIRIGSIYGAAACRWIAHVRSDPSFEGQPVMIFTTAYIYKDYHLDSAPCNLREGKVWISQHTVDGERQDRDPDSSAREAARQLCVDAAGNSLCLFQQYTSYGGFALFRENAALDLDRFFGTEADLQGLLQHAKHPERWEVK